MITERKTPEKPAHLVAAIALQPRIAVAAGQIERERRLPGAIVDAMLDAGLFHMLVPASLGGGETDLISYARTIEAIAMADASTAWCLGQAASSGLMGGFLQPDLARLIFGDPRAIVAWGPLACTAVEVDSGYRLTGQWTFASGGHHATWLGATARVFAEDGTPNLLPDGGPEVKRLLFPASQAEFIDVWHVSGLRGTGSDDYAVKDLFVPRSRAIPAALSGIPLQATRYEHGPLYDFPLSLVYAVGFASVALGIGRAALDAFIDLAGKKTLAGVRLCDESVIQAQVAHAEATWRAARAFLHESVRDAWGTGMDGGLAPETRALVRLAATSATHSAASVVDTAYHGAGSTAIFEDNPFERRFRDVHAVTQQVQASQAQILNAGRFFLHLDPDGRGV